MFDQGLMARLRWYGRDRVHRARGSIGSRFRWM